MTPQLIVPVVAILAVFGMPVAIVYIIRIFKLREKELALEASEGVETKKLEARIARIEALVVALDRDVRAGLPAAPSHPALPPAVDDRE